MRGHVEDGDIGYIRITQFTEKTASGLHATMDKLKADIPADKLKGYILDLRNNPGGLLDQSIEVVNTFVDKGEIVSTRGRNPDDAQRFSARAGRRSVRRQAAGRADQRRLGLGLRDRRRRVAGPQARDADRHALVRQGLRADDHAARRQQRRAAADDRALLHALGPLDPGQGHHAGHPGAGGRARRSQGQGREFGRGLAQGPSEERPGREASGSQAYVPPDEKDDKQLLAAVDLLHGVKRADAPAATPSPTPSTLGQDEAKGDGPKSDALACARADEIELRKRMMRAAPYVAFGRRAGHIRRAHRRRRQRGDARRLAGPFALSAGVREGARQLCRSARHREDDGRRDQRHARLARPAFELPRREGAQGFPDQHEGRGVRRPRARGDAGQWPGARRQPDRRHARGAGRRAGRRSDRQDRQRRR